MDSILNYQNDLSKRIGKSKLNFKKSPKDRLTQDYIESKLETLEQLWSEFRNGHKNLMQTVDSKLLTGDKYISDDIYDKTEDEYTDYKCELKRKLALFIASTSKATVNLAEVKENVKSSLVKLPKINIPNFSGKYTEWITFRDLFTSMIHSNESLDNVQKLQYLKGYLSGEAEQLIRYIPVTDCNYMQCWRQLEERYNNKKYLSHSILKRLLSQRNATIESATFLKDLIDTSSDCLNALSNLGVDVRSWDIIVIHLLSLKLDTESRKQWELNVTANVKSDDLPTFSQFREFITGRYRALEFIDQKPSHKTTTYNVRPSNSQLSYQQTLHVAEVTKLSCEYCNETHKLCFCKGFARLDYDAKHQFVSNNRLCFNCLGKNHSVRFCQKVTKCQICSRRHHSLLHPKDNSASSVNSGNLVHTVVAASEEAAAAGADTDNSEDNTSVANHMACCAKIKTNKQILLATALVNVRAKSGEYQVFRALLDQGSQASFVTEATVQGLGLKKIPVNGRISGLGGDKSGMTAKFMVILKVQSRLDPEFQMEITAYVLQNVTSFLPGRKMRTPEWIEAHQLYLADPTYSTPNKIDILLGADAYCQILKEGLLRGPAGTPVAQCTTLGWILSGQANMEFEGDETVKVLHAWVDDNEVIKRFWELENEPTGKSSKILSEEELKCEEIFATTTTRNSEGRYVVKLPFREEDPSCKHGDSREIAVKRLKALERKLCKNLDLKHKYKAVINEYLELGHMELVPDNDEKQEVSVYLPHHAVIRDDKSTTKLRIVFDASCKNTQGVSLNDSLMIGPTLQPELRHLIIRWRRHPVCIIGDIVKMYRMVRVADEDTDYQRIVWRDNTDEEIKTYRLLTVTFGTASAPYLAVKALNQVALDHAAKYPLAAEKVPKEFYMDDLMTGCESIEEGIQIYKEMTALLNEAGFTLQKWSSNKEELLREIDHTQNEREHNRKNVEIKTDNIVKILGLTWDREQDEFRYSVTLPPLNEPVTKRKIISDVARLFDPLGWIAPSIITAKIFIQRLWISGIQWDDEAPEDIKRDWLTYREQLLELTEFRIPRWLHTQCDDVCVELHGFCDASNVAYAATVYLRSINNAGEVSSRLIGAKTRVAPVKQVSIPRLELCGAVLLSKLLVEIAEVLNVPNNNVKAWTDSTVVLAWLNKHPCNWKTFVANRVSEIVAVLDASHWSHVPTKENPADCASRGLPPSELKGLNLWKEGPSFLRNETIQYTKLKNNNTREEESVKAHVGLIQETLLNRFSSFKGMLRVIAYCRRFITRRKLAKDVYSKHLNKWEIDEALVTCLKVTQATAFDKEISEIKRVGQIKTRSSSILSLTPFVDDLDLLRVGGRLANSQEEETVKHPILLPHNSPLTKLVVAYAHEKTCHGGPQLMLNFLRSLYWIVGAKNLVKRHVQTCVKCIRYKADQANQLMGSLPSVRVTPARPFSRSGVDYAGPIGLRTARGRGHHAYKAYICLFICMVTKAIHLEVVSDLSSRGFLEAFKRFVARRGHCYELYSDNGTNFVGAAKELKELFNIEKSNMVQEIAEILASQGTTWHFIPPRAPNFGGLWEAGIRSTKFHIRRAIGDATLTYEEMSTLLSQIEACLNSRPISIMSTEVGDPSPLTPGHFLIGEALVTIPEINYETSTVSTLKRWHLTQRMLQNFWRRWSNEYLSQHLQRYKWRQRLPEPQIGDVVLVKENDLPPAKWLLGRIEQKHPGTDNLTRVVTLKCKNSLIKRPVSKLCILPVSRDLDD